MLCHSERSEESVSVVKSRDGFFTAFRMTILTSYSYLHIYSF